MHKFRYRFSIGDSNEGAVGFCFDVVIEQATQDSEDAVKQVRTMLADYGAEESLTDLSILPEPFGGICIYINPNVITAGDIVLCTQLPDES